MRKRNRHVSVWMNGQEYRHLKAEADKAGLGIDPFIRMLVSGVQLRPKPPETYAVLLRELSAIGRNINQIAYWANLQKAFLRLIYRRPLSWSTRYIAWSRTPCEGASVPWGWMIRRRVPPVKAGDCFRNRRKPPDVSRAGLDRQRPAALMVIKGNIPAKPAGAGFRHAG